MVQGAASIHSIVAEARGQSEAMAWARFVAAADDAGFHAGWLALLAASLGRARSAVLLVAGADAGAFAVAATWPDALSDSGRLMPTVQRALTEVRGVVVAADGVAASPDAGAFVGYPVDAGGRICAVVVAELAAGSDAPAALRQMHWAGAWLVERQRRPLLLAAQAELARVGLLNELLATALQQRRLQASALAVANELALRFRCERVAVGFEHADRITPLALSQTAHFDPRSDLVRAIAEAMDEVLDLGVPITLPRPAGDELGALAHGQAGAALGTQAMLSVPLVDAGRTLGVITFERHQGPPFDAAEQRLARAIGLMLGPAWALQRMNERTALQRLRGRGGDAVQAVFGPRHPGLKTGVALASLLLLGLGLWPADHRIAARTVVEGSAQLARVAPFEGFIAEGLVRAGDTVKRGQLMARMEDRDLKLERTRWSAELQQAQRKFQVALAQADRGTMGVLAAQAGQAEAQLALVDEKLARAQVVAPFDGVVVSGDLSQSIGTPVELGRTLFEVAPQDGFRIVLQVEDRDIAWLRVGQRGELVLSSLTDRSLPFAVSSVTSVATQHDGRNVFRVEAQVEGAVLPLRSGMEGIGKVVVGRESLLWIGTHGLVDGLRLALWSWTP